MVQSAVNIVPQNKYTLKYIDIIHFVLMLKESFKLRLIKSLWKSIDYLKEQSQTKNSNKVMRLLKVGLRVLFYSEDIY